MSHKDDKQEEQKRSKQKKITEFNKQQASKASQETPLKIKIPAKKEHLKKEPAAPLLDDPQANNLKTEPSAGAANTLPGLEMLSKVENGSKKSWNLKDLLQMQQELKNHLLQLETARLNYEQQLSILEKKESGAAQQKRHQSPVEMMVINKPPQQLENLATQSMQTQAPHPRSPARMKPSGSKSVPAVSEDYLNKQGTAEAQTELLPSSGQAAAILEQTSQIEDKEVMKQEFVLDESQMKQTLAPSDLMMSPDGISLPLVPVAAGAVSGVSQDQFVSLSSSGDPTSKFLNDYGSATPKTHSKMRKQKKKKKNVVDDDDDEEYDPTLEHHEEEEEEEELDNMDEELIHEPNQHQQQQQQQTPSKPVTALLLQQPPSSLIPNKKGKARRKATLMMESFSLLPGATVPPTPPTPLHIIPQTPPVALQTPPPLPLHQTPIEDPMSPVTPARGKRDGAPSSTKKKSTSGRQRRRRKVVPDNTAEVEDLLFDSDEETKGFSTTTPGQLYWNYINHCFIPVTPTSKKMQLLETAPIDYDEIYVVPPLGKHYSEVWAEEDSKPQIDEEYMGDSGFGVSSSMHVSTPSSNRLTRRGAHVSIGVDQSQGQDQFASSDTSNINGSADMTFEKPLLEIEPASEGFEPHSITQRLLAALIEDVDVSGTVATPTIPNGSSSTGGASYGSAVGQNQVGKKTAKKGRPKIVKKEPTTQSQIADEGPIQGDLRLATTDEYSVSMMQMIGEKVFAELKTIGLLDGNEILDLDKREDDEICAELRFLQNELRAKVELNNQQKSDMLKVVKEHFAEEEKREKMDQEYKECERQWRDHLQSKKKRKTAG